MIEASMCHTLVSTGRTACPGHKGFSSTGSWACSCTFQKILKLTSLYLYTVYISQVLFIRFPQHYQNLSLAIRQAPSNRFRTIRTKHPWFASSFSVVPFRHVLETNSCHLPHVSQANDGKPRKVKATTTSAPESFIHIFIIWS